MTLFRLLRGVKAEAVVGTVDVRVGVVVVGKDKLFVFGKGSVFFCRDVAVCVIAVVAIPCVHKPVGVGRVVFVIEAVVKLGFRVGVTAGAGEVCGAHLLCHVSDVVYSHISVHVSFPIRRSTTCCLSHAAVTSNPRHSFLVAFTISPL